MSDEMSDIGIDHAMLGKLQVFHRQFLQKDPDAKEIRSNKFAGNSKYLPISFMEMQLDEIFFGLWQTRNFVSKVVANEIIGEMEVWFFHPVAKTWLCRVGAGAVMIQYEAEYEIVDGKKQKIKTDITDISKKITNTLTKDYPHLKAECFRNACLSIGKAWGRDLNREFDDQYAPVIRDIRPATEAEAKEKEEKKKLLEATKKVIDAFDIYKGNDKETLKKMCHEKMKEDTLTLDALNQIASKIGCSL
jgi:hypothetical protein